MVFIAGFCGIVASILVKANWSGSGIMNAVLLVYNNFSLRLWTDGSYSMNIYINIMFILILTIAFFIIKLFRQNRVRFIAKFEENSSARMNRVYGKSQQALSLAQYYGKSLRQWWKYGHVFGWSVNSE